MWCTHAGAHCFRPARPVIIFVNAPVEALRYIGNFRRLLAYQGKFARLILEFGCLVTRKLANRLRYQKFQWMIPQAVC